MSARNFRGRSGRDEDTRPSSSMPCRYFTSTGDCRFGARCRFSHSLPHQSDSRPRQADRQPRPAPTRDQTAYSDWKYLIKKRQTPVRGLPSHLTEVWTGAVEILNGNNPDLHQQLTKDLIDDKHSGCEHILLTLQLGLERPGAAYNVAALEAFLDTITHSSIVDCLSIGTYVATIYNVISGAGGERALPFFIELTRGLLRMAEEEKISGMAQRFDRFLSMILTALHQLVTRERRVCFHDSMPELLAQLDHMFTFLNDQDTAASGALSTRLSKQDQLDSLTKIVNMETGRLGQPRTAEGNPASVLAPSLVYPVELPTPGGHHDNDHADISRISVFPTPGELLSDGVEYLPSTDFRQPHFLDPDTTGRYLDSHFRLLRHDVFGPLKAGLSPALAALDKSTPFKMKDDAGVHLYRSAFIAHLSVHEKRGFEINVTFDLPHRARKMKPDDCQRWWDKSKRLEPGSLVCLTASCGDANLPLLLIITHKGNGTHGQPRDPDSRTRSVAAKLASLREEDLGFAVQLYSRKARGILVGIPGLLPATFTPILRNLQDAFDTTHMPFQDWTIPRVLGDADSRRDVAAAPPPPRYAQSDGFAFDLSSILRHPTAQELELRVAESLDDDESLIGRLEALTTLDRGQCRALVYALTHEFALIQGPPGTGKSYLGVKLLQVLLAVKDKSKLGPIVVICYTNHALDQFLCHLLEVGIRKIIRIGGQSKTEELDGFNLRNVSSQIPKTKHEGFILGSTYSNLEKQLTAAGQRLGSIHKLRKDSWDVQKRVLSRRYPLIYQQIYHEEVAGYTLVGKDAMDVWVYPEGRAREPAEPSRHERQKSSFQELAERAEQDIWSLLLEERKDFSDGLLEMIEEEEVDKLFLDLEASDELRDTVDDVHREVNRRALMTADVIGITTTGLARDIGMLRNLRSKVVICEEAGEVLEAHVISAMMPGVEHFIQIGDHQQLRPQINNFSLSLESKQGIPYQLDRSQFERLAVGQPGLSRLQVAQLSIQRRMRPEVSKLIHSIYPGLQDHGSVMDLPDVVGMRDNVFWLNHPHVEDGSADDAHVKSHSNAWEVEMTKALVRHIIRQGVYKGTDIAVLTPYSGQLHKLRDALNRDFDISISDRDEDMLATDGFEAGIDQEHSGQGGPLLEKKRLLESLRLATVDNFQGEEAKVIIVSLVRSNPEGKVGFLRTTNRINVLLSRAKHGMYLVGSADTYSNVPMWVDVRTRLEEADAIGSAFNLCCPRHKDTPIQCAHPEDFLKLSPEGGCSLPCEWRLERCGHQCLAQCHSPAMHAAYLCPRPCPRRRSTCDHACPKLCGEECGSCMVRVNHVRLPCGHFEDNLKCYQTLDLDSIVCVIEVKKKVVSCGHIVTMRCSENPAKFRCTEPCDHVLACGHPCPGTCGKCNILDETGVKRTRHSSCNKKCERPYNTCNHVCNRPCHADEVCPPCARRCEVACAHSKCSAACSAPCTPCIEKCTWSCEHQGTCSMPCGAPCDRLPCNERCTKMLECGHRCPGLCGEPCPEAFCQICSTSKTDARVDLLEFKTYSEIDLDETPIVALSCGHFFTAESLDGLVSLGEVYTTSPTTGEFSGLREPSEVLAVPKCPDCKRPVQQHTTRRYNRVVNNAIMNETSKRFLVKGMVDLQELEQSIDDAESALSLRTRPAKVVVLKPILQQRQRDLLVLAKKVNEFIKATAEEQQPARKLFDAILDARSRRPLDERLADLSLEGGAQRPMSEHSVILGGRLAHIKIKAILLSDQLSFFSMDLSEERRTTFAQEFGISSDAFFTACDKLISESTAQKLPRYAVLGTITYARVARAMQSSVFRSAGEDKEALKTRVDTAKQLLQQAVGLCDARFEGSKGLKASVESVLAIFGREWHEEVTAEELKAIKEAMVSGPGGIATHSGHWYTCVNGHVFAIGECGMPMEEARCAECGARIGGRDHSMVDGMSRARNMEE